jgi:hypothetical protein
MKPLLITLSTAICTLAGWQLGSSRQIPPVRAIATAAPENAISQSTAESRPAGARRSIDVKATMDRLIAETAKYSGEQKFDELAARIYPAFQNLPNEEFAAAIVALSAGNHANEAGLLAGMWAERDLTAARDWAVGLGPRRAALGPGPADEVFAEWARRDTPEMLTWLEAQVAGGNSSTTQDLVQRMIYAAAESDPERGFRLIAASLPDKSSKAFQEATRQLYANWVGVAPEAAAARALAEPDDNVRASAVGTIAIFWKVRDAAVEWVRKLPDPLLANSTLRSIAGNMALDDEEKGLGLLASLPQTDGTRQSMRHGVAHWAWLDFHAALGWVADLDDAALAPSLMAEVVKRKRPVEMEAAIAALPPEQRTKAEQLWQESRAPASGAKSRP